MCVCEEPQAGSSHPLPTHPEHWARDGSARWCRVLSVDGEREWDGLSKVGVLWAVGADTGGAGALDRLDVWVAAQRVPPPLLSGVQGWLERGSPSNSTAPDPTSLGGREREETQGCETWVRGTKGSEVWINGGSRAWRSKVKGSCSEALPAPPAPGPWSPHSLPGQQRTPSFRSSS